VDILISLNPAARTFDNFMAVSEALESAFNRRVDLVTDDSLSPYLGPRILQEVQYVDLRR
jgi:predicted nucleotidyltransferase